MDGLCVQGTATRQERTYCHRRRNLLNITFFDENIQCELTQQLDIWLRYRFALLELLNPFVKISAHADVQDAETNEMKGKKEPVMYSMPRPADSCTAWR
jgi:hypothetical protein